MISIVLLQAKKNLFSSMISFIEGSPISHAAIGLEKDGVQYLLSARWGGVGLDTRDYVLSTHNVYSEFEIIPNVIGELALAEKRIGQPYGVLTLLGYIAVLLGRDLHIGINNPFYSKSAEVCSEFVIELDIQGLIPEFKGLNPANITPKDLDSICSKGSSFKRLV